MKTHTYLLSGRFLGNKKGESNNSHSWMHELKGQGISLFVAFTLIVSLAFPMIAFAEQGANVSLENNTRAQQAAQAETEADSASLAGGGADASDSASAIEDANGNAGTGASPANSPALPEDTAAGLAESFAGSPAGGLTGSPAESLSGALPASPGLDRLVLLSTEGTQGSDALTPLAMNDYHPDDIAIINRIIREHNIVGWYEAIQEQNFNTIDETWMRAWQPGVTWSENIPKRVVGLDASNKHIAGELDVSGLTELRSLVCSFNQITSLKISGLDKLEEFDCRDNSLTVLDLSGFSNLKYLYCSGNQIGSIDATNSKGLELLWCGSSSLTSLNVEGLVALRELEIYSTKLSSLDLSSLYSLEYLWCTYNDQLVSLDLTGTSALKSYYGYGNPLLTSLDLSDSIALEFLDCSNNGLTTLNVSGLDKLEVINCWQSKQLTSLDISGLDSLRDLSCYDSENLTSLILSDLPALATVDSQYCRLESVSLKNVDALMFLKLSDNRLTSLDVSNAPSLSNLLCDNNLLASLNVAGLSSLYYLTCSFNQLTSLDLTGLTTLGELSCHNNKLLALDFAGLTIERPDAGMQEPSVTLYGNGNRYQAPVTMGPDYTFWDEDFEELDTLTWKNGILTSTDNSVTSVYFEGYALNDAASQDHDWFRLNGTLTINYVDVTEPYTITFDATGGVVTPSSDTTTASGCLQTLPTPTRSGFDFVGWYSADQGGTAISTQTVFTANTTIYAQWQAQTYTITFDATGGVVTPSSDTTTASGCLQTLPTPTRSGFDFVGWYSADQGGTAISTQTVFTANTTIYAHWTRQGFVITFNAEGGSVSYNSAATSADGTLPVLPSTVRTGYQFEGWYDAATGGSQITAATVFTQNATVYARWTANVYTVDFVDFDGTSLSSERVTHGNSAHAPANPTRAGYTFSGWSGAYSAITSNCVIAATYTLAAAKPSEPSGSSGLSEPSDSSSTPNAQPSTQQQAPITVLQTANTSAEAQTQTEATPAQASSSTVISTSQVAPTETPAKTIEEAQAPQAAPEGVPTWVLPSIVFIIAIVLLALVVLALYIGKRRSS